MKYYFLIIAILVFTGACSSNPPANQATGGTTPAEVNSNQQNANLMAATNSKPPSEMQPYSGMQNVDPNAFNASTANLKTIPYKPKPGEMPYGSRTAPDDSIVVSGSRGKDFIETRTFNNHPIISKVEKIMDGKNTKYKVYLKSGKVVDAPADKMTNFTALAPNSILEAIGMKAQFEPDQPLNPQVKEAQKP